MLLSGCHSAGRSHTSGTSRIILKRLKCSPSSIRQTCSWNFRHVENRASESSSGSDSQRKALRVISQTHWLRLRRCVFAQLECWEQNRKFKLIITLRACCWLLGSTPSLAFVYQHAALMTISHLCMKMLDVFACVGGGEIKEEAGDPDVCLIFIHPHHPCFFLVFFFNPSSSPTVNRVHTRAAPSKPTLMCASQPGGCLASCTSSCT